MATTQMHISCKKVKKLSWFPGLIACNGKGLYDVEYTYVYPSLASDDATRSARSFRSPYVMLRPVWNSSWK